MKPSRGSDPLAIGDLLKDIVKQAGSGKSRRVYLDALEHHEEVVMNRCMELITENFEEILRDLKESATEFLTKLNFDNFVEILRSDNLNIAHEKTLIEIARDYIAVRDKCVEKKVFTSAQDKTPPEIWALLTDSERQNRQEAF